MTNRTLLALSLVAFTFGAAPDLRAQDDPGAFVVGLHFGVDLPVFSPLGVFILPRVEVGGVLPVLGGRLQPYGLIGYGVPPSDGEGTAPALSGSYSYQLRLRQLMLGGGLRVRFLPLGSRFNPYAAIGVQADLMELRIHGQMDDGSEEGEAFGENRERMSQVGVHAEIGVEFLLGPGALFVQLGFSWSRLDEVISGQSNTGRLFPMFGYRFVLPPR